MLSTAELKQILNIQVGINKLKPILDFVAEIAEKVGIAEKAEMAGKGTRAKSDHAERLLQSVFSALKTKCDQCLAKPDSAESMMFIEEFSKVGSDTGSKVDMLPSYTLCEGSAFRVQALHKSTKAGSDEAKIAETVAKIKRALVTL